MLVDMKESVSWTDANPTIVGLLVAAGGVATMWIILASMGWVWHLTN